MLVRFPLPYNGLYPYCVVRNFSAIFNFGPNFQIITSQIIKLMDDGLT